MSFAVLITIHDEERNIGHLLERLLSEPLEDLGCRAVVVVSSASTDRSDEIVREHAERSPLVQLVTEPERRGKAAAINLGLTRLPDVDVVVLMSGDVLPRPGALALLLQAFDDQSVGMVGGRPMPAGRATRIAHHVARVQWDLHHEVALQAPKLGEAVAFRAVVDALPADTAVDEAALEAMIRERGLRLAYVPEAVIENSPPDTIADFLKQRRRIAAGHAHLRATGHHVVSTDQPSSVLRATLRALARSPLRVGAFALTAALEVVGKLLGWYDLHVLKKNPFIWDIAASTKQPASSPAD